MIGDGATKLAAAPVRTAHSDVAQSANNLMPGVTLAAYHPGDKAPVAPVVAKQPVVAKAAPVGEGATRLTAPVVGQGATRLAAPVGEGATRLAAQRSDIVDPAHAAKIAPVAPSHAEKSEVGHNARRIPPCGTSAGRSGYCKTRNTCPSRSETGSARVGSRETGSGCTSTRQDGRGTGRYQIGYAG